MDIAVCGCGPAGLAAALLLHRQGHRITLFERFEKARPVGSGLILQPTGLGVLAELGLADAIVQRGARIDRLLGKVVPSGRTVLDVRYSDLGSGWHGVAVHRSSLFDVLYGAASSQIEIVLNTTVTGMDIGNKAHLLNHDQRIGPFDLIVDCMGANSPLLDGQTKRRALVFGALWTNVSIDGRTDVQRNVLEQRYVRSSHMTGILPIGTLANSNESLAAMFWSLKRDRLNHWRQAGLQAWKDEVSDLWPIAGSLLESITSIDDVTFAQYDHFTLKNPCGNRFVHIGDSAHATSPQLGQGANMALLDALALSHALETNGNLGAAIHQYALMRRWHVRLFQMMSLVFTPMYQSDSHLLPWIRDWLAAPLIRLPLINQLLARLVAGLTVQPLRGHMFKPYRPAVDD